MKKKQRILFLSIIALVWLPLSSVKATALADSIASLGTDYWVYLDVSYYGVPYNCYIHCLSIESTDITIERYGKNGMTSTSQHLNPYSRWSWLNEDVDLTDRNPVFHITSSAPICCYAERDRAYLRDIARLFPTRMMGTDYRMVNIPICDYWQKGPQDPMPMQCVVVAIEDGTYVYHNSQSFGPISRGSYLSFNLEKDYPDSIFDFRSNVPVAAFSMAAVIVPSYSDNCCGDYLLDQLLPMDYWGTEYVTMTDVGAQGVQNSTLLTDTKQQVTIDYAYAQPCGVVRADSPFGLTVVTNSKNSKGGTWGDPARCTVIPWNQRMHHGAFYTPGHTTNYDTAMYSPIPPDPTCYVNIVVETSAINGMMLDCQPVPKSVFNYVESDPQFSFARLQVQPGVHYLDNDQGEFLATAFQGLEMEECFYTVAPTPIVGTVQNDTICESEYVVFNGKIYTKTGVYYDTISVGCHNTTINTLNLTVLPPLDTTVISNKTCIRSSSSIRWYEHTISSAGTYTHIEKVENKYGCDSIVKCVLEVSICPYNTYSVTDTTVYTNDLPFIWFGNEYTEPGTYYDTLYGGNFVHGDSIGTLILNILPSPCDTAYTEFYKRISEQELPYTWNQHTVVTAPHNATQDTTLVFSTLRADLSCDSIATLHLHVLFPCEPPAVFLPAVLHKQP